METIHSLTLRMISWHIEHVYNFFKDLDLLTISIRNTKPLLPIWSDSVFYVILGETQFYYKQTNLQCSFDFPG